MHTAAHLACAHRAGRDLACSRTALRATSATLAASGRCWHARPLGVSAVLTLAPGRSPWRSRRLTVTQLASRTVAPNRDMARDIPADLAASPSQPAYRRGRT